MTKKTIDEASQELHLLVAKERWFVSLGIGATQEGEPCIHLNTIKRPPKAVSEMRSFVGYAVIVNKVGRFRPI